MKYLLLFLNDFGTWQTKLWNLAILAEKIWARSSKVFSASPEEDFQDNLLFLPFIVFFLFPGFDRAEPWYYQKFPTCRQNCISCVTWNILKVNRIFSKQKFFSISLELWVEKGSELSDLSRRGCQKCYSCVRETLWGKSILLKWVHCWIFFEVWTEEKFDCSRIHKNRSVETAFLVSRGKFGRKQFFWRFYKFFVRNFGHWEKKIGF